MMRIVDTLIAIPSLLYVILLMMALGPGLLTIIVAMAISGWLPMARMVRGQVLALKEREFVFAARLLGVSPGGIVVRPRLGSHVDLHAPPLPDVFSRPLHQRDDSRLQLLRRRPA